MELSYKDLINNCVIDCAHDQLAVTCSVDTKDRGGVKKLLGLSAECKVYTAEAMKGEAKITGKACYKVIYIDRDNKTAGKTSINVIICENLFLLIIHPCVKVLK